MKERAISLLTDVGFTGVEAAAYLALLQEPGVTGYRLSRLIDKPVPNTYKALDSLTAKGAVMLDDSARGRSYTAVPIGEYLEAQKRSLDERRKLVEAELASATATPIAGGIYQINSAAQVYERVRSMLEAAKSVALIDAYPTPLAEITPAIKAAAKRKVNVLVIAYAPVTLDCCEIIAPEKEAVDLSYWDGDWLNVAVDWDEYLYSLIKKDGAGVHRAVWSGDAYLAVNAYNGLLNESVLRRVFQLVRADKKQDEIRAEVNRLSKLYSGESQFASVVSQWRRETSKSAKAWKTRPAKKSDCT
jgi:HTH-type transcriptional regulator, sugar sensing transcriptional regulator